MTKIGDTVVLNGQSYKVVGTVKKSFLLEKDGKQYKATQEKINKIIAQNSRPVVEFPHLERRLAFRRIFDKDARMPETQEEIMNAFVGLLGELSPENLCCDGEASPSQVAAKRRDIKGTWAELERKLGRKVSEEEAESQWARSINGSRV